MDGLVIAGFTLSVIVLAVVELAKLTGLPSRFAPAAAALVGIAGGIAAVLNGGTDLSVFEGAVAGFMSGLTAVGLYSGTRNISPRKTELPPESYPGP